MSLRVTLVGLGAIGRALARELDASSAVVLAAAADPAPALAGQDLGTLLGDAPRGLRVHGSAAEAYAAASSDVALLCTSSWAADVAPQILEAVAAGRHVVTTCEELAEPALHAERTPIDEAARRAGVAVVATGVNPGLVMDRLPLLLAQACVRLSRMRLVRHVDLARRRVELQRKVGVGLTVDELELRRRAGRFGHVGLRESAHLLARRLGFAGIALEESLAPVIATDDSRQVATGRVLGIAQRVSAREERGGRELVLELEMSLHHPAPLDEVTIEGDPPIRLRIEGGVMGDRATIGTVKNALAIIRRAAPGLHDVAGLPLFGLLESG